MFEQNAMKKAIESQKSNSLEKIEQLSQTFDELKAAFKAELGKIEDVKDRELKKQKLAEMGIRIIKKIVKNESNLLIGVADGATVEDWKKRLENLVDTIKSQCEISNLSNDEIFQSRDVINVSLEKPVEISEVTPENISVHAQNLEDLKVRYEEQYLDNLHTMWDRYEAETSDDLDRKNILFNEFITVRGEYAKFLAEDIETELKDVPEEMLNSDDRLKKNLEALRELQKRIENYGVDFEGELPAQEELESAA